MPKKRTGRSPIQRKDDRAVADPIGAETQQIEYVEYEQKATTDIPQDIVEALARDGHVLQWATYEVRGQPVCNRPLQDQRIGARSL